MIHSAIRWLAFFGVSGAVVWLCWQHEHGGAKGMAVPVPNVAACVVVAAVTAVLCRRFWLAFAAPFVAGLAGVLAIAEPRCGPYGGLLGILVGIWILLLPVVFHFGKAADQATPIRRFRLQFGLKHLFACAPLVAIGMPIHRAWGWLGVVDYVLLLRALSGLLACWRGRRRLGLAVVLAAAVLAATEVAITYASRPMLWWLVWEWKTPAYLATLGSTDSIAHEHVAVLLNRHGIDWWGTSGAGTGYEVFCPQDSARAVRIIKADALTYGYEVRLRGGWRTPKESVPPTVKRDIRKPMAALLSMP
ncbi:MAG: hypothetical protein MUF25_11575, partial [Pirellulaceae bacterium]|nr:hypothetical protein [Pirellulaceae bacterium]